MAKGNFFSDTADEIMEFGISTAKSIPVNLAQTFNPLKGAFETNVNTSKTQEDTALEKLTVKSDKPKSTDLNLKELEKKYANQDKITMEAMKSKLFHLVKNDEEKAILERKREEEERKQRNLQEEYEKKQKQHDIQSQQNVEDIPQGKVRKQFGATTKKVVADTRQELKGNKGSG